MSECDLKIVGLVKCLHICYYDSRTYNSPSCICQLRFQQCILLHMRSHRSWVDRYSQRSFHMEMPLVHIHLHQLKEKTLLIVQWWIQDFHVGAPTYYLAKIYRKLHENEENF